jgi:hypothetical protein
MATVADDACPAGAYWFDEAAGNAGAADATGAAGFGACDWLGVGAAARDAVAGCTGARATGAAALATGAGNALPAGAAGARGGAGLATGDDFATGPGIKGGTGMAVACGAALRIAAPIDAVAAAGAAGAATRAAPSVGAFLPGSSTRSTCESLRPGIEPESDVEPLVASTGMGLMVGARTEVSSSDEIAARTLSIASDVSRSSSESRASTEFAGGNGASSSSSDCGGSERSIPSFTRLSSTAACGA